MTITACNIVAVVGLCISEIANLKGARRRFCALLGSATAPTTGHEDHEDIEEEGADGALLLGASGEAQGSFANQVGPAAAGEVGQDEEGFPKVGGAVGEAGGNGRFEGGDLGGMIGDKASAFAFQLSGVEAFEALALFGGVMTKMDKE